MKINLSISDFLCLNPKHKQLHLTNPNRNFYIFFSFPEFSHPPNRGQCSITKNSNAINNPLTQPKKKKQNTLVEAWVVKTVVQPSPMVNPHEMESPYTQYDINKKILAKITIHRLIKGKRN